MKRIQSACLEQLCKFENSKGDAEADFQTYINKLNRKGVRYKLISREHQPDGSVTAYIKLQYLSYDTGHFLD